MDHIQYICKKIKDLSKYKQLKKSSGKEGIVAVAIEDDECNVINMNDNEENANDPLQYEWIINSACAFHV